MPLIIYIGFCFHEDMMKDAEKVYALLKKIPRGKVATYKGIALALGMHPRAVAAALRMNKDPFHIPCYKVVHADGRLGGYSCEGGIILKERLLKKEGVLIKAGRVDPLCILK